MGDEFQFGVQFGEIVEATDVVFRHGNAAVEQNIAAKTVFPVLRKAVPPVAKRLTLIDFSGIDAGNLDAVVLSVEVDFYETIPHIVDLLVSNGFARQVPRHGDLEEDAAIVTLVVGDALQIEFEVSPFEEEVNVFQIGLHILINRCLAVHVEVVLHLHLVIDEDFAPTFGEHDFLFRGRSGTVADEVHRFFQIGEHRLDFALILGDFVFGEFLGLTAKGQAKQQYGKNGYLFHG